VHEDETVLREGLSGQWPAQGRTDRRQCDSSCKRRFKGCSCRARNGSTASMCLSGKCECRLAGRECDPYVCLPCGMASNHTIDMSDWDAQGRWRSVERQHLPSCGNRVLQIPPDPSGVSGFAGHDADTSVGPRWRQRSIWFGIVRCPRLPNRRADNG
jgi:hypothetical protein